MQYEIKIGFSIVVQPNVSFHILGDNILINSISEHAAMVFICLIRSHAHTHTHILTKDAISRFFSKN